MTRSVAAVRRLAVTILGGVVLAAGIAMLVLPGPGLLTTAAGLAILATEYDWARRHVVDVRHRAHHVSQLAGASIRNTVLSLLSGLALGALGVLLVATPSLLPAGGVAAGVGLLVGGGCVVVGTGFGYWEHRRALRTVHVERHRERQRSVR